MEDTPIFSLTISYSQWILYISYTPLCFDELLFSDCLNHHQGRNNLTLILS
ncbi:hypothetical protein H8356DRAFT_1362283 [Neocallimastix lanati (nom. inval.)]|nr:hypothetical protein H8356DRAFT_1362283 [Neocallimastix sp. JGI-2020a]